MSETAIEVENLSKRYVLGHQRSKGDGFRHTIEEMVRSPIGWLRSRRERQRAKDDFWALKDLSFEIKRGEVVGIIGRNGAGKSTLLKILSRITEPTNGKISIEGRVASLLEVGTGFHPELTGRENIFLNGAILGMSRVEIRRKFDEIVAFSEIEKFLDTPVKRYSSGMYVRLAFAVAAHLEPEILIVDEVLAVGDSEFQKKCMGKMNDVRAGGRTILFVSHNMAAIRTLCTRGIVLSRGQMAFSGGADDCIREYEKTVATSLSAHWARPLALVAGEIGFKEITLELQGRQPQLRLCLEANIAGGPTDIRAIFSFDILDNMGAPIMQAFPTLDGIIIPRVSSTRFRLVVDLPPLVPGTYSVTAWIGPHNTHTLDFVRNCVSFTIHESPIAGRTFPHTADHGFLVPPSTIAKIL
jgi:lipopolysaccharide transport system ATP-binding protein